MPATIIQIQIRKTKTAQTLLNSDPMGISLKPNQIRILTTETLAIKLT